MFATLKNNSIMILLLLLCWSIMSVSSLVNPMFLPAPWETLQAASRIFSGGKIYLDMFYSFQRVVVGIGLSVVIGVPLGLVLGYYAKLYDYLAGLIDFFRSIPPIVTFPLSFLILGIGEASRIAVIFFGCVFIMLLNTSLGVLHAPKTRVMIARTMGAGYVQLLSRVVFFDALPQIFVGLRISLSMGVIIGIVSEMVVGTSYGLGSRVVYAQTSYAIPEMYCLIILIGLIGLTANKLLALLEHTIVHWQRPA